MVMRDWWSRVETDLVVCKGERWVLGTKEIEWERGKQGTMFVGCWSVMDGF